MGLEGAALAGVIIASVTATAGFITTGITLSNRPDTTRLPTLGGGGGGGNQDAEDRYAATVIANAELQSKFIDAETRAIQTENVAVLQSHTAKTIALYSGAALIAVLAYSKLKKS